MDIYVLRIMPTENDVCGDARSRYADTTVCLSVEVWDNNINE